VIELSSQAFVPKGGFRLVPFGAQIVAQAVGWPAYPLLAFPFAPNRPTEANTPRQKWCARRSPMWVVASLSYLRRQLRCRAVR